MVWFQSVYACCIRILDVDATNSVSSETARACETHKRVYLTYEHFIKLTHLSRDVLPMLQTGLAGQAIPDDDVIWQLLRVQKPNFSA
ncbi:hypothetical protein SD10_12820 [Spirosoma radiotolerans]|uniref:Uncharacterized protein n=1 Tax=Spirosoma radiotolerans TaxID=1379870 RepID=A0A0E3ZWD8_9BACT|nr:hypothetical protein SD10_12820 [Spirosoma radiotolerans]